MYSRIEILYNYIKKEVNVNYVSAWNFYKSESFEEKIIRLLERCFTIFNII